MTGRERGFLLLRSQLGDPKRKPLTQAQLRTLRERVRSAAPTRAYGELEVEDLTALGYREDVAAHIVGLLKEEDTLDRYLDWGARQGCAPIAQTSDCYPMRALVCLGGDAPGCLWAKGDLSILEGDKIALVGSRDLGISNAQFARRVGEYAAENDLVLVSGNARGADQTAQEACLANGGKVISVVADELYRQRERERVLYLSEEDFDAHFSARRALSRNRIIHCLGNTTFVAQCGYRKGGTWDGAVNNLKNGWSTLRCYDDGSPAMRELEDLGAILIETL